MKVRDWACGVRAVCAPPPLSGGALYDGDVVPLWQHCHESNLELLRCVAQDKNSAALHARTLRDARLGRMSEPVPADEVDLRTVSVCMQCLIHVVGMAVAGAPSAPICC